MGTEGIQDKYINPYTDFGFKLLFGTAMNKELLISFLNALLFKEETVKDVTYLNAEHLDTQEYDRRAVFDVYAKTRRARNSWWKCSVVSSSSLKTAVCIMLLSLSVNSPNGENGIMSESCLYHRHP